MKKILAICSLLFLFTGCGEKDILDKDFVINTTGKKNAEAISEFYYSDGEKSVFLVNLEEVTLIDSNKEMRLYDYLVERDNLEIAMDFVTSPLAIREQLFDGGTRIYQDKEENQVTSSGITIIACRTMDGNRDYYIGPKDLNPDDIKDGYCGK